MALKDPFSAGVDAVAKGAKNIGEMFTTNKENDAQRSADEQMALLKAYQEEFNHRENRNWVDSVADGFNRLIRPFIVILVISIFIIAYISPGRLAEITAAISVISEGYWQLLSIIIAFYFGGRMQLKSQKFKFNQSQAVAVKSLIETRKEFRKLEIDIDEPDTLVGESIAKSPIIDQERSGQINSIVEMALATPAKESDAKLKGVIERMKLDDVEKVKKRRKFGKRSFL